MQRENRLTRREDFNKVYRHGKSFANQQFVVYVLNWHPSLLGDSFRLGISVSKKVGNAVVRNRLRRMIKEIVRLNADKLAPRKDLIIIVRKPAADLDYARMEKSILHVLKRAEVVNQRRQ